MREILFRGKRADNGEWVYGDLLQIPKQDFYSIFEQAPFAGNYNVISETVGQYTGLTDENGTKIFEGDIVNMHGGCEQMDIQEFDVVCRIVYGRTGYGSEIGFSGEYGDGMRCALMLPGALNVIGNIHDNPELLKEIEQ